MYKLIIKLITFQHRSMLEIYKLSNSIKYTRFYSKSLNHFISGQCSIKLKLILQQSHTNQMKLNPINAGGRYER